MEAKLVENGKSCILQGGILLKNIAVPESLNSFKIESIIFILKLKKDF